MTDYEIALQTAENFISQHYQLANQTMKDYFLILVLNHIYFSTYEETERFLVNYREYLQQIAALREHQCSQNRKFQLVTDTFSLDGLKTYNGSIVSLTEINSTLQSSSLINPTIEFTIPESNKSADSAYFLFGDDTFCIKQNRAPSVSNRNSQILNHSKLKTVLYRLPKSHHGYAIFPTPTNVRPIGLINQGNTCYMNCILQVFSHYYEVFINDFDASKPLGYSLRCVLDSMKQFSPNIDSKISDLRRLMGAINYEYNQPIQIDAKNFLFQILDKLKEESNIQSTTFIGNKLTIMNCDNKHESFNSADVPVINLGVLSYYSHFTIQQYVNDYFYNEVRNQHSDSFYCISCMHKIHGEKLTKFMPPKVVCLYIDNSNCPSINILQNQQLWMETNMYELDCIVRRLPAQYDSTLGHFITIRRIKNCWVEFNDFDVKELTSFDVEGAYLLFYSQLYYNS